MLILNATMGVDFLFINDDDNYNEVMKEKDHTGTSIADKADNNLEKMHQPGRNCALSPTSIHQPRSAPRIPCHSEEINKF